MNLNNIEEIKDRFAGFNDMFNDGRTEEAISLMGELLETMENSSDVRRAGDIDMRGNVSISKEDGRDIYICLSHVMEYYIYAYYYKPETDVKCCEIPFGEYYRNYAQICIQVKKYKTAVDAYKHAICWNPVDLDALLGLSECYKHLDMLERYLLVTRESYRFCCSRATMARYYRNMGFYYLSKYKPEIARCCYVYSNIYYKTENADNELSYIESALDEKTPEYSIKQMQKLFDESGIEPGPDADTIGIIYRVGEIMMEQNEYALARDCFSICYDITCEDQLKVLLDELEGYLKNES